MCSKDMEAIDSKKDIKFDRVITNIGNGFNPDTSHFVAPVNGLYVFFSSLMGKNKPFTAFLLHNGAYMSRLFGAKIGCNCYHYPVATNQIILQMKKGDEVWLELLVGDSVTGSGTGSMSNFNGYLLWADWQTPATTRYQYSDSNSIDVKGYNHEKGGFDSVVENYTLDSAVQKNGHGKAVNRSAHTKGYAHIVEFILMTIKLIFDRLLWE